MCPATAREKLTNVRPKRRGGAVPTAVFARYKNDEGRGRRGGLPNLPRHLDSMRTPGGILAVLYSVVAVNAKPGVDQQIAQLESSNSKLLQYPTQFTQSIMPKAIHSHNDCERDHRYGLWRSRLIRFPFRVR